MINFNSSPYLFGQIDVYGNQRSQFKELHNILFQGSNISPEWIKWYFNDIRDNLKDGKIRTYGVFDSSKLIGIWNVEPKLFTDKDLNNVSVGRCFAVGIHPDYRRLGLFVTLSQFAIEEERKLGVFEYILGFPQVGRSVIGGHLKAGWEEVQEIPIYSYKLENLKNTTSRLQAEVINNFKVFEPHVMLPNSFDESTNYKNIRWLKHPDHQYICMKLFDSYIVLKPYSHFCHILDLKGSTENILVLLEISKSLCKRHGWTEINVWCSDAEIYKDQLIIGGFTKGSNFGSAVKMIAVGIKTHVLCNISLRCHLQMGIEEPY